MVAQESTTRFFITYQVGRRDESTATCLFGDVESRRDQDTELPLFTSDDWDPYLLGLLAVYGRVETPPYKGRGRPPKPRLVPPEELLYAQVKKYREKGRVVKVERKLVFGTEEAVQERLNALGMNQINTSYVERQNLTLRSGISRLVRKSLCFSKDVKLLKAHLSLFLMYYNFARPHRGLKGRTPAMAQGITDRLWTLTELMWFKIPPV